MKGMQQGNKTMTRLAAIGLCAGLVCTGCAEDGNGGADTNADDSADGGDGDGSASEAGAAEGDGAAQPPGPSADGWASDEGDPARISCDDDPATLASSSAPRLSFGDATIYVGYEQIGDNQNPIVARVDAGEKIWCQVHETEGPDGRAVSITWDGGDTAYVVYTIVGGGSSLEGKGGWLSSYAPGSISGGGPKVSYVGKVAASDGALTSGTFIIAVKSDNKVNSHSPAGAVTVLEDDNVEFRGSSAHKPIDANKTASMDCSDYPFDSKYVFTPDLDDLVCAQCTNCVAEQPCD